VLVDQGALAAGLLWLVLYTSQPTRVRALSVPAAFLAVCSREVWGPVIVVTVLALVLFDRRRVFAVVNALAAGSAFVMVTFLVPTVDNSYSESDVIRYSWHQNFAGLEAVRHTTWGLVFAVGVLPAIMLCRPPVRWLRRELAERDVTGAAVLLVALLLLGSAVITGSDVTRYLYLGGLFLIAFSAPWLVANRGLLPAGAVLAIATVLVWDPAHHFIASDKQYLDFYYGGPVGIGTVTPPTPRTTRALIVSAVAFAVAVVLVLIQNSRSEEGEKVAVRTRA
jgi:hypothetical protein